jgi:hypothetical protein
MYEYVRCQLCCTPALAPDAGEEGAAELEDKKEN